MVASDEKKAEIQKIIVRIEEAAADVTENDGWKDIPTKIMDKVANKQTGRISTNCNKCRRTCHCHYSDHAHVGWELLPVQKTVHHDDPHKKKRYFTAKEKEAELTKQREAFMKELEDEKKNVTELQEKIQNAYQEIARMAILGYNDSYEAYVESVIQTIGKSV